MRQRATIVAGPVALALAAGMAAAAETGYTAIALSGQPAPGMPAGVVYGALSGYPRLNNGGRVMFQGTLVGPGVTAANDLAGWAGVPWNLGVLYREGGQAAALPAGVTYENLDYPVMSHSHQVVLELNLLGAGVGNFNDTAVYAGPIGSPTLVLREGAQAVGMPAGVNYLAPGGSLINYAGTVLVHSFLTGPGIVNGNDAAWYHGTPGNLQVLARHGNQAPGLPAGIVYSGTGYHVAMNDAGWVAFSMWVAGPGVGESNDVALFAGQPGNVNLLAREGMQAPGLPAGVTYALGFAFPQVNNVGKVLSWSGLAGPGVTPANDTAVWYGYPGSWTMMLREGQQAAGFRPGVLYGEIGAYIPFGHQDRVAIYGKVQGSGIGEENDSAIWTGTPGNLDVVAYEGGQAPGTPAGVSFGEMTIRPLSLNAPGQVAFEAPLTGSGVTAANDMGLWVTSPGGTLQLVIREGDTMEVAPGDVRTVQSFSVNLLDGSQDGRGTSLSDAGRIIFQAAFTDGTSGVFTAETAACYANCDGSTTAPRLNVNDFVCFQTKYAAGDSYANCDGSSIPPVLNVNDFICFQQKYAAGCP